ncbi:MAG: Spore coat domain protein [Ramlibacter sp.]|nr:Spore coat domain protein [Ramlibacter sp.]
MNVVARCLVPLAFAMRAAAALAGCSISTGASLGFGPYAPLSFSGKLDSLDADSTGSVTVTCTALAQAVNYSLKLSGGHSNEVLARAMAGTGGGALMNYNLFVDANRSNPWGDGIAGGTFQGTIAAAGGSASHTFYGRVPAGQRTLRPGGFSDQLQVTLEYTP